MSYDEDTPSPRLPAGLVAVAIAGALAVGLVAVLIIAAQRSVTEPLATNVAATRAKYAALDAPASAPKPAAGDPWPECAAVRQWFPENVPDPKAIEIIRWLERRDVGHGLEVLVKYRGRNHFGATGVFVREFYFSEGRLIRSRAIDPDRWPDHW